MGTDIMINTLTRLNSRMKRQGRNILMFLDNAPCHPASLKGMFPNVRIEFLPKHTTSCTKPLEAGIINTWKVHYRRKLLRYVLSQVDGKSTVSSEIVKSVDLLVAVRWMVSAWEEVEPEVISRCFKRVGMFPEEFGSMQEEDDPSAGEELLDLEALVTKVTGEICHDVAAYVTNADDDATPYEPYVDGVTSLPSILKATSLRAMMTPPEISTMQPLRVPPVTSISGAIALASQLAEFADWQGMSDVLFDLKLKSLTHAQSALATTSQSSTPHEQ